jgi:cytochrome c biogenesis factor
MILAAEGVLQYALIAGRYELQYVFSFSERALPLWYKIAGAWAGQEGSFLLWAIWTGLYGLLLMRTAGRSEPWVMTVYAAIVLCLMGILAYQSPFAPVPPPADASFDAVSAARWAGAEPVAGKYLDDHSSADYFCGLRGVGCPVCLCNRRALAA